MATTTAPAPTAAAAQAAGANTISLARVLDEGYGPGAWHGADLKAALADVPESVAFWRPGTGRHNIAEIALHHAYCVQSVVGRLTGTEPEPFVIEGIDWFELPDSRISWPDVVSEVEKRQRELSDAIGAIEAGQRRSPLSWREQFDLVLGVTCHAVYHSGQIQLIKVLRQSH